MVSYADLTDPNAVEAALDEFDRLGRSTFLDKYGYGEARDYFLVTDRGRYDSKAIFAAAYEAQHGVAVANDEISGGKSSAARRLQELGTRKPADVCPECWLELPASGVCPRHDA